jgi:hypothetical protein
LKIDPGVTFETEILDFAAEEVDPTTLRYDALRADARNPSRRIRTPAWIGGEISVDGEFVSRYVTGSNDPELPYPLTIRSDGSIARCSNCTGR